MEQTQTPIQENSGETAAAPVPAAPTAPVASSAGRLSVDDNGQIFLQKDHTNPLPGEAVGKIKKGEDILKPVADVTGDKNIQDLLDIHIRQVLEPIFLLGQTEGEGALSGVTFEIGERVGKHLGVVHRADLEDIIPSLDADMRRALRGKGIRLGPILAFMPALVKPAAVRMRAILWALWNDKSLPMPRPVDGRVSEIIDPEKIDRHYYRMIGYPVFGPRAIRIDMLDRVVTDVYDTAAKGVFEVKHKYAEWLGCSIEEVCGILESMGHRRIREKEDKPAETSAEEAPAVVADEKPVEEAPQPEGDAVAAVLAEPKVVAPLVRFILKRGKMSDRPAPRRPQGDRKPAAKKAYDPNKSPDKSQDRNKDKPRKPKFDKRKPKEEQGGRTYTFESKVKIPDDDDSNPFAVLKKFKS